MIANLPATDLRQLIPLVDCVGATWHNSRRAFYDWASKYGVTAYRHGMYRRADIDTGLAKEERLKGIRRARNRKAISDRKPLKASAPY